MNKKIVGVLACLFVFSNLGVASINVELSDNIWESNNLMNPNPENIFMQLDINGISYGHELLWKANTTGTNYEESAVASFILALKVPFLLLKSAPKVTLRAKPKKGALHFYSILHFYS